MTSTATLPRNLQWKRVIDLDFLLVLSTAAGALPPDRVFALDAQTFVNVAVNLLNVGILAIVLAKVLYKPVKKFLQKRTDRIQDQFASIEKEMADATDMKHLYEQKLEEIERERDEILAEARKSAMDTGRRLVSEAKKEAETIRERAASSVELEWQRAQTEMRTAIIDVSAVMAEKFVTLAINKETHDKLFDETMADLEGMTWTD